MYLSKDSQGHVYFKSEGQWLIHSRSTLYEVKDHELIDELNRNMWLKKEPKPTLFNYKSYTGATIIQQFKCSECGCKSCYRHKSMYGLSFFEGHFHCMRCKKEASYATDDWTTIQQHKTVQLQLF